MRLLTAFAVATVILSSTPAFAGEDKPADAEKKICRRTETTGSILGGKRQCHTKAEWKNIDDANADAARKFTDRRNGLRPGE